MLDRYASIDLETTGLDVGKDQICQIAVVTESWQKCRLVRPIAPWNLLTIGEFLDHPYPGQKRAGMLEEAIKRFGGTEFILTQPEAYALLHEFGYTVIPAEATAIHGIKDEDVADAPTFKAISKSLLERIADRPILSYNGARFDIPLLWEEFHRAGIDWTPGPSIDVAAIYRKLHPRTLVAAVKEFLGEDHTEAHDAGADASATLRVLMKMLCIQEELPKDLDALVEYAKPEDAANSIDLSGKLIRVDGHCVWNFGKHKGKRLEDTLDYADWCLRSDFPANFKQHLERELLALRQTV